jgi:hypothetical protein
MRPQIVLVLSIVVAGCATTTTAPDLTGAATQATNAATIAHQVNKDLLSARLMKMVTGEVLVISQTVPTALVCLPSSPSVELTGKELGAYADAINAIAKVAAKPTDVSYAGYLQQFRKDQSAIDTASKDTNTESEKDLQQTKDAQARCSALLTADLKAELHGPAPRPGQFAVTAIPAVVASIDGLIKSVLSAKELAKRDEAVRKSTAHMVTVLRDVTAKLQESPGPYDYVLANAPNTRLGNTLSIHRWMAARRLQSDWEHVVQAQTVTGSGNAWEVTDRFVADADSYVSLSAIDSDKLLTQLTGAIDKANDASGKASLAELFDSLSEIGSALSGINDKYSAFRKTIN